MIILEEPGSIDIEVIWYYKDSTLAIREGNLYELIILKNKQIINPLFYENRHDTYS